METASENALVAVAISVARSSSRHERKPEIEPEIRCKSFCQSVNGKDAKQRLASIKKRVCIKGPLRA